MNFFEMLKIGGPHMKVISILAIVTIVVAVFKIVQIVRKKEFNLRLLDLILMAGSLALAFGLFSQIMGIIGALEAIRIAGDISPQLVMEGAKISFFAPVWGFIVFIISLLFYFILKEIIKAKQH